MASTSYPFCHTLISEGDKTETSVATSFGVLCRNWKSWDNQYIKACTAVEVLASPSECMHLRFDQICQSNALGHLCLLLVEVYQQISSCPLLGRIHSILLIDGVKQWNTKLRRKFQCVQIWQKIYNRSKTYFHKLIQDGHTALVHPKLHTL